MTRPTSLRTAHALSTLAAVIALTACASSPTGPSATAQLKPTTGNTTSGTVQFVQKGKQVQVSAMVNGLKPGAVHGFHIHEKGDCSSGDGLSAGGHFNPTQQAHGKPGANGAHHLGDLLSLDADPQGVATFDFVHKDIALDRGSNGILGRGLIVHNDPDDYTTQPTGNSGARLACAVIERGA